MESVGSFNAIKSGKAYIVEVDNLVPDDRLLAFHVDSGASVTLIGLNSFCRSGNESDHELLKGILEDEILKESFMASKTSGSTVTKEEIDMYPCKFSGVSIAGTSPITLYFHIYLGNIGIPLLGFDYIDDTSYHHSIAGDLIFTAVQDDPGKRFYPEKVIDFNKVMDLFIQSREL